ncbi:unnamed protein product [Acanthocheilonema viteae]|uniref:Uncharacterized protein n=1 Tax=Acanthocheilonema viteae TaxID=6277 RepID=A0A498S746_ACAVI|nr:unnamed protein product [Acanthocheilonema viteae]
MPLFEGCCSNLAIDRKKSTAYAPSTYELETKQQQQQQPQQQEPSTSKHARSLKQRKSGCCSCREMNGSGKNPIVRFNEGLPTGSTEMLHATNFYQNCVDEDTESRWMEVYEEQRSVGQTSSENDGENEVITSKLSTRSTIEIGQPKPDNSSTFLEKTHSAEPKGGNFESHLQRCHEMENIDKVAQQG